MNQEPSEEEITQALSCFVDTYLEDIQKRQEQTPEPFAAYELALRGAIHKNSHQFKKRFIKGYFTLFEA